MRRLLTIGITAACACVLMSLASLAGPPNAEQRQQIADAKKLRSQVTSQANSKKYDDAIKALDEIDETIKKLHDDGVTAKDSIDLKQLEQFVEQQKKLLEKHRSKDAAKSDEPALPIGSGGTVSFVKDVAPIFARNCQGCHGGNNARSGFSLVTFRGLMKGGERGQDIVPGKPDESTLYLLLEGKEEPRMPLRGRKLREDLIQKVATWIKEGAKFDGAPKFTVETLLSQIVPSAEEELKAKVAAMSESELLELHKEKAKEHWAAANPAKSPTTIETDHFIVTGTLSESELSEAGKWAEAAVKELNRMFAQPAKDAIWKGKLTVHLFADRHEYTEHAQMVEKRELPPQVSGHRHSEIETSYVAVPNPKDGSPMTLKGQLTEQVAAAYLAALGDTPRWYNVGVGRSVAAKLDPKAEIYRDYRSQVRAYVTENSDAVVSVLEGKGSGDADLLGFGLVDFLMSLRGGDKGVAELGAELRKKTASDKAIQSVYKVDKAALGPAWTGFAAKKYPVAKKR